MSTTETIPDCQIAQKQLVELFDSLGITTRMICMGIQTDESKWKHKSYSVQFERTDGHRRIWAFSRDYRQGTSIKTAPVPSEVFACLCSDYQSARCTFEDWCAEFGYEAECDCCGGVNFKAQQIYSACRKALPSEVIASVGKETVAKLAELHSQL